MKTPPRPFQRGLPGRDSSWPTGGCPGAGAGPVVSPAAGSTEHIVSPEPGRRLLGGDGLIAGLHEPRSSHMRMLAAFAGRDLLGRCYAAAIDHGYLWHEFGDLHLLLP